MGLRHKSRDKHTWLGLSLVLLLRVLSCCSRFLTVSVAPGVGIYGSSDITWYHCSYFHPMNVGDNLFGILDDALFAVPMGLRCWPSIWQCRKALMLLPVGLSSGAPSLCTLRSPYKHGVASLGYRWGYKAQSTTFEVVVGNLLPLGSLSNGSYVFLSPE